MTAAKKRSSARPAPARLARHGAAQRLAGCRLRHQSLASFAHGSVIRIRRAPKSMIKVASSWVLMTRPRPYLSYVTWSCSANCSAGGAGGAGPKGLVGRRRPGGGAGRFHHDQYAPPGARHNSGSLAHYHPYRWISLVKRAQREVQYVPGKRGSIRRIADSARPSAAPAARGAACRSAILRSLGKSRPLPSRFFPHVG